MFKISFPKFFCLIIGLILINGIIFSQNNSGSWNSDSWNSSSFGFNSRILDSRFDRADREITPQKWIEEARRGIESAKILWEEMIPELYRDAAMLETLSHEFDKWSESELEKRFTDWLLNRFFGAGMEQLTIEVIRERERADRLYLYKTDEEGNILFDEKTGDPLLIRPADEAHNYENDLVLWRRQIEDSAQNEIQNFESHLIQSFPELLIYIDENRRGDFGEKFSELTRTAVQSMQNEFDSLIAREQRLFAARRLGDIYSLRKKSEDQSASSLGASLIEDVRRITNEGIAVLEAKIETAEAGNGDLALAGTEWLSQYREQFERGLRAWEEAEERFFIRRVEWEQDAISYYYEANAAWNEAFVQFDEARREWEYKAKSLFESGELLFKNASAILEKTILEAKAEFATDSRIRTESATDKAKAWADMYITALSVVAEAEKNLEFWQDRLARVTGQNSGTRRTILREIENWTNIYKTYKEKAMEARNFLQNEFNVVMGNGSLLDIFSQGVSSEDFFLDEYQLELLRSQAVAGYWSKRVTIAQAVLQYAEDLTAGRITESEGLAAWEKAKTDYDDALLYYQNCMDSYKIFEMDISQMNEMMKRASEELQRAEAALDELNHIYASLIAAYEIQKEEYFLDEIAYRYIELMEITNILDSTGPDSIMVRYLKEAQKVGLVEEAEFKTSILKELINGGFYYDKSLAELTQIAQNIIVFNKNETLPDSIEEFGITKDNLFYEVLKELLLEKKDFISQANEEEWATIAEKYDIMITALTQSAKNSAIRQEQNRILALKLTISSDIELMYGVNLYKDWENACQNLFQAQVKLELQALKYFIYGKPTSEEAMLLSGFCLFSKDFAIHAENALEYILSILVENNDMASIGAALQKATEEDEYIEHFTTLGSFFVSSNGCSFTDFFLDSYIAEVEVIEGMMIAYKFAESINPIILESVKKEKIQNLYNKYTELGIECTKLVPDDIDSFIDVLISNSDDPTLAVAKFLSQLDDVIDYLPEWISFETTEWKDLFIELFSYRIIGNVSFVNVTDLLNKITETEFEYVSMIMNYQNGIFYDTTLIFALEKELDQLYYQLAIIDRVSNTIRDAGHNEIFLNSLTRKTKMVNLAYDVYEDANNSFSVTFYDLVKKYVNQSSLEWDDNLLTELSPTYDEFESLINELNLYIYKERVLNDEIENLMWNLELIKLNNGSLEQELESLLKEIELHNENVGRLTDAYFEKSENFSKIVMEYESQYTESKKAFLLMEEMRHEYEIQDAIKRWASTAYLDTHDVLDELNYSQEKLLKSETYLDALVDLLVEKANQNAEYQNLYEEYKESYSDLYIAIKASESVKKAIEQEIQNNKASYEAYHNELMYFGGNFANDYFNKNNSTLQALINFITVKNGKLAFSRDGKIGDNTKILDGYFAKDIMSEYGSQMVSDFENALNELNQKLRSYNFTPEKYIQWGGMRDYLLASIFNGSDENMKKLLGIGVFSDEYKNINDDIWSYRWSIMSEQEKADLEFYTILYLIKPYELFNRMSDFLMVEHNHDMAYGKYILAKESTKLPIVGLFKHGEAKKAKKAYEDLIPGYDHFLNLVTNNFNGFIGHIDQLNSQYANYTNSFKKLSSLYGNIDKTQGLLWEEVEKALIYAGMNVSEIKKMENFWMDGSVNNNLSSLNVPQVLDFILSMKIAENKDKQLEFENLWNKINEEHLTFETEYLNQFKHYLSGNISLDTLLLSATETFGNNHVTLKQHLSNIEQLIGENIGLFSSGYGEFKQVHYELVNDYLRLINRANTARYDAELKTREAEWEIQRKDIEEKYLLWLDDSRQILERGREDWKNNSIKMNEAYSLWLKTFDDEYQRTGDAWTAAYFESMKDKEAWVERATRAAEEASSEALLVLIGSDGEASARAMDTRDPVYYQNFNGVVEAQKTLDDLLNKSGIHKLDGILSSAYSISGTVNTSIRSGLSMNNMSNYRLVQAEASRLAKTAKEDISSRQFARIAVNLRDMADWAINQLVGNVGKANENMREQIDMELIVNGGWRRSGFDYHKDVLVHSTFFNPIITESVFIEGYKNYDLAPIHINTDLSEERIKYLDSIAVQILMESIMQEVSEMTNRVFGSDNSNKALLSRGEFNIHVGEDPNEEDRKKIIEAKSANSILYGSGELGRVFTNYYYWYFKEQNGLALLNSAPWDKPLWDSRSSFFDAPSLKTTLSIGAQVVAAVVTGGMATPLTSALLGIGTDLVFGALDVAGGYKSWQQAGVDLGKSVLTNSIGAAAGTFTSGLTTNLTNAASSGAISQFSADMGSLIITGMKDITVGTINSAVSAVTYDDKNSEWGWSSEIFKAGVTSSLKSGLVTATGSFTTSILNIGLEGFTKDYYSNGKKLNNLVGGLAGQGVNYAMGGDFTLNLFNLSTFNNGGTNYNLGLLELRIGKNGTSMTLGTGGADASIGTLSSALKGLETWKVNTELFLSDKEATNIYKSQLRTLYSGDEALRKEYENVLAGKTVYKERRTVEYTQSIYNEVTGVKTVYLGSEALDDGSRFGLNVYFSHEAYRNGLKESDELQEIKTRNAFYGHSQTALDIVSTYGINSLGDKMGFEAIIHLDYLLTGNNELMETILGLYDSSDEYWKLIKNENDIWSWINDKSNDFDIRELLDALDLEGDNSAREELNRLSILSGIDDGKGTGIISAERMNPHVAGLLGNAIISQSMQNGIFEYGNLDAQSIAARNFLIKDTMNKMAINTVLTTGVYNEISPMVLGKGAGDVEYDYLVPYLTGAGHAVYMQVNREQFLTYYDLLLFAAAMQQNGKNYVWGGKDPERDGGLDCSGLSRWAQMQVYGQNITIRKAHDQINDQNLTLEGNGGMGTLNYYSDNNGGFFHHVAINIGNGIELNPNGGEGNKRANPAKIEVMAMPQLGGAKIVQNRRTNWHYLFFTGDNNSPRNYF